MITQSEPITTPTDPEAWRAYIATLDEAARLALFSVARGAVVFRCPTNGRLYVDDGARAIDGACWARCWWCDQHGRVRFQDANYDDRNRQPHGYPIVGEVGDADDD